MFAKPLVGRQAAEERRWTRRASEGMTEGFRGELGTRLDSGCRRFEGLGSKDMGA